MGEDMGTGLLEGSHTKSGVPIEHLDYQYVERCENGKELEKILKVLRSGEEGFYPELVEFTEERLRKVNPKSKSLRKEIPIKTYHDLSKTEEQEITNELQEWMTNISETDKSLKEASESGAQENDNLPPIRSVASNEESSTKQHQSQVEEKERRPVVPRSYHEWDSFDPDKELESLDKKEEEKRKKNEEKAKIMNTNAAPSNLDVKGKSETEKQVLANREKEKGNEAFQSGNYTEALMYYCCSIDLNPKATAVYNNRALAEIKLEKFQEAIDDCNKVLSAEPNNVKAYLRRSIAHRSQGLNEEATADLYSVLDIEPNNKRAKELLGEMKKNESKNEEPTKPGVSEDARNLKYKSTDNKRTNTNIHSSVNGNAPSARTKGKRLKIVEIDSENDTETVANLNGESCIDETNEPPSDLQVDSNNKTVTIDGENVQPVDKPQVQKQPELPVLVVKAQDEGTRLFKLGSYAKAAEKFTQAIDILQKDKFVYNSALCSLLCNRGSCLMKIGDCAGCVLDCTAALELTPGAFRPLLKRAEAYETSEKFAKAWFDYQMVLKIQPQHPGALQGKLRASKHLESLHGPKWREKVGITNQPHPTHIQATDGITNQTHPTPTQAASERTNQLQQPHLNISGALSTQPTPTQDVIDFTTAAKPSPQEDVSGITLSPVTKTSTVESRGDSAKSSIDPAVRFSQCKDKGNAFVKQNRCEEAVECYTECIDIDPENVAVYTNRALCYLRLNQDELAIQDTTEALRLQPNNVKALFRRALAKKALCQYDSAARDLFELQKIEPKNAAAKKELDIVLDLCRKERRETPGKKTKTKKKKKTKDNNTEVITQGDQPDEAPTQDNQPYEAPTEENQPGEAPKWRRINITDVQHDDEDDEQPVAQTKEQSSNRPPSNDRPPLRTTESSTGKPIKLAKKTAYDFFQAWNSVKKGNTKEYADLLRQLETKRLAKVLSNKLDAPMLNSIVAALSQEVVPQGEEKLACDILEQLTRVERFDMVLLFMSAKEKNELQQLFSKLKAARTQQNFVTSEEFDRLQTKYKTL